MKLSEFIKGLFSPTDVHASTVTIVCSVRPLLNGIEVIFEKEKKIS